MKVKLPTTVAVNIIRTAHAIRTIQRKGYILLFLVLLMSFLVFVSVSTILSIAATLTQQPTSSTTSTSTSLTTSTMNNGIETTTLTWLEKNFLQLIVMIITVTASFFSMKILIKLQGAKLLALEIRAEKLEETIDEKFSKLEDALKEHKESKFPHVNCAVHTATLSAVRSSIAAKVDISVYTEVQKSIDQRFTTICDELTEVKQTLSPLGEISKSLKRIEEKLNKE